MFTLRNNNSSTQEIKQVEVPNISYSNNGSFEYAKKETLLKVENLSVVFGDNVVLKDVNVEVKNIVRPNMLQGQVLGFLGPSGVGKTLLFECLAGLRSPTTGTIEIFQNGKLEPVKLGTVGVVQQKYPLFNHRTIYSNLEVAAKKMYSDPKERKDKIMDFLEKFRLTEKVNDYPAQLSGGQRQRVAIAQQLLCSENFLLLDEPFSGLDIKMIEKTCELLTQVSQLNELMTIIIVSHDIVSTSSIADTLWLMGREFGEDKKPIKEKGAKIKYEYDLINMGLAWQKDIMVRNDFNELIKDVRGKFENL